LIAGIFTAVVIAFVVLKYIGHVESERSNGTGKAKDAVVRRFVGISDL